MHVRDRSCTTDSFIINNYLGNLGVMPRWKNLLRHGHDKSPPSHDSLHLLRISLFIFCLWYFLLWCAIRLLLHKFWTRIIIGRNSNGQVIWTTCFFTDTLIGWDTCLCQNNLIWNDRGVCTKMIQWSPKEHLFSTWQHTFVDIAYSQNLL